MRELNRQILHSEAHLSDGSADSQTHNADVRNLSVVLGYPDLRHRDDAIFVRTTVDILAADETQRLLGSALRLAVGPPETRGKKVAMHYVLRGSDGQELGNGRLKIRFDRNAPETSQEAD